MKIRKSTQTIWRYSAGLEIISSVLLSACSKDIWESKNKKSGNSVSSATFHGFQSFLTPSELTPPKDLPSVTAEELKITLEGIELGSRQKSDTTDAAVEDCDTKKMRDTFIITANKSTAQVDTTVDFSECLDSSSTLKRQVGRVYMYLYSDTCDISGLDRKSMHGDEYKSFIDTCPRFYAYSALRYALTDKQDKVKTWAAVEMDPNGLPFEFTNDAIRPLPDHSEIEISDRSGSLRYFRRDSKKLVSETDSTYYSNGSIAFTYNDWRGTVTFLGPNTQPRWQAERGAEKASGTLGGQNIRE